MNEATKVQMPPQSADRKRILTSSPKRKAILVLGMHRSGTSAVGGVISALGVAGPKTLMPPTDYNPRGYFESATLVAAHDEMLAAASSHWNDWRQINPQWLDSKAAKQHRQRIKRIIIDEYGGANLIFIKDPRICRFIPFISSILVDLNFSLVAVLVVRNPLEVAYSLKQRNDLALSKSMLLWLRHVLEAEFHSRHMSRTFLSYANFLADWRHYVDRTDKEIGITWPDRSDRADIRIDQFLSPYLHHQKVTLDEFKDHPGVPPLVREAYNILTNIVGSGEDKALLDQMDLVRTKFEDGCQTFGPTVVAGELVAEELRGELNTRNAQAEELLHSNLNLGTRLEQRSAEASRLTVEHAALVAAHDSLVAERNSLAAAHDRLIAKHDSLTAAHTSLLAECNNLATIRDSLIYERDALALAHGKLNSEYGALAQDYINQTIELDALTGAHSSLLADRDAIIGSYSWRLTAPLRSLRKFFTR